MKQVVTTETYLGQIKINQPTNASEGRRSATPWSRNNKYFNEANEEGGGHDARREQTVDVV